ncbi:MAG: 50S ribosomal protein L17 [Calditrichaeota bacterium]|nr:MAG: 50S ribosomal protein L17 [Calditrichota bacterium]
MRHGKDHKNLGRTASHRRAMLSNLVASLFEHKQIRTTLAKAKEGRRFAERCITFGKKGTLAARRHVYKFIPQRKIIKVLFDEIAPTYTDRNGGYTRIIKLGRRKGDGAEIAILELVGYESTQLEKQEKAAEKRAERKKRKEEQEKTEEQAAEQKASETAE